MNKLNFYFALNIIYADFEHTIQSAVLNIFPKVIRKSRRFYQGESGENAKCWPDYSFSK